MWNHSTHNTVVVELLCAKPKVTSLNVITIPQSELRSPLDLKIDQSGIIFHKPFEQIRRGLPVVFLFDFPDRVATRRQCVFIPLPVPG